MKNMVISLRGGIMAALFMYLCKNCGKTIFYTKEEAETAECSCKDTDYICLDINPVEYQNMSPLSQEELIRRKLRVNLTQFEELKAEWSKLRKLVDREYYAQRLAQRNEQRQNSMIKCPYCQSSNIAKISTAGRVVSVGLFGLASGKIGKQWHCNNCKSDF